MREKETLLTGVTRDGTFLIEDGEITRPLRDVRFTDSALGVLERTQALTRRRGSSPTRSSTGGGSRRGRLPALRCSGLRITGGA